MNENTIILKRSVNKILFYFTHVNEVTHQILKTHFFFNVTP